MYLRGGVRSFSTDRGVICGPDGWLSVFRYLISGCGDCLCNTGCCADARLRTIQRGSEGGPLQRHYLSQPRQLSFALYSVVLQLIVLAK